MQFFLSNLFDISYSLSHCCNTLIIFVITKIFKYKNLFYGNNIKYLWRNSHDRLQSILGNIKENKWKLVYWQASIICLIALCIVLNIIKTSLWRLLMTCAVFCTVRYRIFVSMFLLMKINLYDNTSCSQTLYFAL